MALEKLVRVHIAELEELKGLRREVRALVSSYAEAHGQV